MSHMKIGIRFHAPLGHGDALNLSPDRRLVIIFSTVCVLSGRSVKQRGMGTPARKPGISIWIAAVSKSINCGAEIAREEGHKD